MENRDDLKRRLSVVQPARGVPYATGKDIPAINSGTSSGLTHLGEHFTLPQPPTEAPQNLRWTCSKCGIIEPLYIPSLTGRWIKRSCDCQRAERRIQQDQKQMQTWAADQRSQCFGGWLGRQWASESIVREMTSKTFKTYASNLFPEAFEVATTFVCKPRGNLIFTGDYGTGKTHLASAIANALLEQGKPCRFASAPQLYESYLEIRKQYDQMPYIQLQERLYGCAMLILDDVDKIEPTNDMHRFYFTLFDERYKARKSTVITTNRYDELDHYIGKAALSRLSRALQVVEMVGDDYRMEESFDW